MIQVVYRAGPRKGESVITCLTRQSAQEYIAEQHPAIRERLGILETRNGEKKEAGPVDQNPNRVHRAGPAVNAGTRSDASECKAKGMAQSAEREESDAMRSAPGA